MSSANCHLCFALYFTKFDNKIISRPAGIFADYLKTLFLQKIVAIFNHTTFHTCIIKKNIQRQFFCIFATFKNAFWAIEFSGDRVEKASDC